MKLERTWMLTNHITMTMVSSILLLLGVSLDACVADEPPPVAEDDALAFRSLPLPSRYCQKPTDLERFTIGEFGTLAPGGRWYVTRLVRHDRTAKLYGAAVWGPVSSKVWGIGSLGLLAIDVRTGAATALLPSDPADAVSAMGRGFAFRIVDQESCYVWFDRSGEASSKENRSWSLNSAVYQWNFRTGRIEKRGYNWVIAEFAAVASPTLAERIVWPQRFDPDWDGIVTLRGRTPGETIQFSLLDADAARQDRFRSRYWNRRPRFLPGSQDNEVMLYYMYSHGPGGVWLSMISFDEAAEVLWSFTREQLGLTDQRRFLSSRVARGLGRNHSFIPLVDNTLDHEDDYEHLYVIRSKDGSLLLEKHLGPSTPISGVAASNDGSLITWTWYEGEYLSDEFERSVGVLDVNRGIVLSRRAYTIKMADDDLGTVCPMGFDSEKQAIFANNEGLFRLASPYKGHFDRRFSLYPDVQESRR